MIVRCWGSRGSISVSGRDYIKYGGDTTCIEIRTRDNRVVVVDAGSGIRRLGNRLLSEGLFEYDLLFTHTHWDHILGFPFFKPIYLERASLTIHSCLNFQGNMDKLLSRIMAPPHFPVPFGEIKARMDFISACSEDFHLGSLRVRTIPLSHPNMGVGYRFDEDGKSFVFLTDNELSHRHRGGRSVEEYVAFSKGADLLFHDAEYTEEEYAGKRSWGHSHYREALDLALAAGVGRFGLYHHNQDRDDAGVDWMVGRCRETVRNLGGSLDCFGVRQDDEFAL
ncbi:MAG TPA: MBL fold metallo-hydrolase [Desulfovibrio sp.]|nr:MBL fold metallo-hydrolase [Desulfovibrio sp.]